MSTILQAKREDLSQRNDTPARVDTPAGVSPKKCALGVFTIDEANELRRLLHNQNVEFRARKGNGTLWIDLFGDVRLCAVIRHWKKERETDKRGKMSYE